MYLSSRTFLALVVACAIAPPIVAQEHATVHGYIADASSKEMLISATARLAGTTVGAASNHAGYYTITGIEPGTYTLVASYLGYQTVRQEISLTAGERLRLDVSLKPEEIVGDEVVVTADREDEEARSAVGRARMPVRLVTQLPAVFEADVFRSIQLLPGVKAASDFSSGLHIRGGGPDQTLIMLDRTTVYNPTHLFGLFSTFNPDALKDVQIHKGGYPAEYGGRLGSVVDIRNKDGNRERTEGRLAVGMLSSRVAAEGPHGRGSWILAGRRSTLEPILPILRKNADGIPEKFYFYDVNGKVTYDATSRNRLSVAFYGGADHLDVTPSDDVNLNIAYGNRTASANWTRILSQHLFSEVTVAGSQYFSRPTTSLASTDVSRRNEVEDLSVKADIEYVPGQRHGLQAGVSAGRLDIALRDVADGEETLSERLDSGYGSLYAQHTWRPTHRWTVRSGLRASGFTEGGYSRLDPRLSVEREAADGLRLQAAYGRYHQFLTLITSEFFTGGDVWLTASEGVAPSWGDQYVLGVKASPARGVRVDAEVYYRTMRDLFELDPNLQDVGGLPYDQLFRFGDGYAYGAELFVERTSGPLTGFVGYTYGSTQRRFPTVNGGAYFPPKYDRTHDLNVVANYRLNGTWQFTSTFVLATGQAYTEPTGRTEYRQPMRATPTDNIVIGRMNASRLPAYHRLDIGVTRKGRFFGVADSELQLQVINLYNRRNAWFYDYDLRENPAEVSPVQMLPMLPNISYSLSF